MDRSEYTGHINEFFVGHKIIAENLKINKWKRIKGFFTEKNTTRI